LDIEYSAVMLDIDYSAVMLDIEYSAVMLDIGYSHPVLLLKIFQAEHNGLVQRFEGCCQRYVFGVIA